MRLISTKLVLMLTAFLFMGCETKTEQTDNTENVIVTVRYKTQPEKSAEAVVALTELLNHVKTEPNFVSIDMHVDSNDNTNILLYEVWSDGDYYNGAHMETEHLQKFIGNSRNFLAGPPEIMNWKCEGEF
jgi:quinol monooxygenase YgiN